MSGGIYEIRNVVGGHRYIGQAVNIEVRWRKHVNELRRAHHRNRYLQRAWNKYGAGAFKFVALATDDAPWGKQELTNLEQDYVDFFRPEYNICRECVSSSLGISRSVETRAKIASATRRQFSDPRARERASAAKIGNKNALGHTMNYTPRQRARVSAQMKGNKFLLGHKPSAETRAKMAVSQHGRRLREADHPELH